jgi:uncharacterized protein (DUF433 family)
MIHVIINKDIANGAPTIRGRRLTVFNVSSKIYYEENLKTALEDYELSIEEVRDALKYCSNLDCQKDKNLIKFCSGCILRTLQDGWNFSKTDYDTLITGPQNQKISISKDGSEIFLGTIKELENNDFGLAGWLLASSDIDKYPELRKP